VYNLELNVVRVALQVYCLTHLESLIISGDIDQVYSWPIPYEIGTLTNLTYLSLSFINGTVIPETIGELKLLRGLSLGGFRIKELTGAVAALSRLTDLNIDLPLPSLPSFLSILPLRSLCVTSAPTFTTIPEDFFKNLNPTLLSLSMSISNLVNFDPFTDLTNLTSFTYTAYGLCTLPWQFTYMTSLRVLRSEGVNCLSSLPKNFTRTLTNLYLYQNSFTEIPIAILMGNALSIIDMSLNQITDISSMALTRSPLRYAYLSYNGIQSVPPEIINLSDSLIYLSLSVNQLTTLPAEQIVQMKKLTGLDVTFNKFDSNEIARLKSIFAANPNLAVSF
jgi:Leucine-rich repeat (LRR) protein